MLLSSASAKLDAPSASAVPITNCCVSEYCLRDMCVTPLRLLQLRKRAPGASTEMLFLRHRRNTKKGTMSGDRTSLDGVRFAPDPPNSNAISGDVRRIPVRSQEEV